MRLNTPRGRSSSSMRFADAVADPRRIERQLDRLAARARGRRADALVQDGVRFVQLLDDRERAVTLLSRALADASYRPGVARVTHAHLAGKVRELARVGALDLVVHAVVADVLASCVEPTLSEHVYSYRRGRSAWQALRWLARVAIAHRAERPDPKTRGIYVLRSDVKSYTDSIPLTDDAPIWSELAEVAGLDRASPHFALVRALVQPPIQIDGDAQPGPRDRGVLFGVATTAPIANLYLRPLDAALEPRGAYARFGDDVLFASHDPDAVREATKTLARVLAERGLEPNEKKLRVLFWNGAARTSDAWPEAKATAAVPFLGAVVRFDGTIALAPAKWTAMLHDVRARIRRTAKLVAGEAASERAKVLASVVEQAFDVRSELALAHAPMLVDLVSDRAQLRQLDHLVALWLAEEITGKRGPRAFRELPPRRLREAGLASRVALRNRGR